MQRHINSKLFAAPLLAFLCLCASSCATRGIWLWGLRQDSELFDYQDSDGSYGGTTSMQLIGVTVAFFATPVTVGWDILTLPFQLWLGCPPYGKREDDD